MPNTVLTISGKNLSREAIAQLKADIDQTTKALQEQGKLTTQIDEKNKQVTQSYTGLTVALGATAAGLGLLTRSLVTAAMTQQKLMMGLSAVEGGAKGAEQAMKRLIEVAKLPGLTLQQATQGYISLRAIDMQAGLAERSLKAFGNALVTVGKGAPELNMVVLALTQMSAKGKILGQDLRQLQEQLPQIRKVMKMEYGTADLETIQKILEDTGQTADQFIEKMVIGFEKLPKVTGGAANAVENFGDVMFRTKAALGEALLPYLIKLLDTLSAVAMKFQQLDPATRGAIAGMIAVGAGVASLAFSLVGINKIIPEVIALTKTMQGGMIAANTATGIWAVGLSGVVVQLGFVLAAAISVGHAINAIRDAATKPIDMKAINAEVDTKAIERLEKVKSAIEKRMTSADYKKGEVIGIGSSDLGFGNEFSLEKTKAELNKFMDPSGKNKLWQGYGSGIGNIIETEFGNLDPLMKTEDLLERINSQINKIKTDTLGKKGKSTLEFTESTRQGMLEFEDLQNQFKDLTTLGEAGYEWTPEQRLDWWSSQMFGEFVPSVTEKAKIGIKQMIKQYSDEVAKETKKEQDRLEKAGAERDKIWFEHAQATAKTSVKEYNPSSAGVGSDISGVIKPYYPQDTGPGQKGGVPFAIGREPMPVPETTDYGKWFATQEKIWKAEKAFDDDKKKIDEKAAEEQQKAQEEALKLAEQYRDAQLQLYKDMADSIGNIFAQIPGDLIKNFKDVSEVLKNMLNNILSVITNTIGKGIGISISNALTAGTGQKQGGGIGDILKTIMSFASLGANILAPGITPALTAGTAGLTAVGDLFFDDPYNDLMAYQSGSKSAVTMSRKSSLDFINNFEKGFSKGNQASSADSGLGGKLDKLIGLMENTKYEFYLDSNPIASKVRKVTNKKTNRGEWA